jgi:hypothetical protein
MWVRRRWWVVLLALAGALALGLGVALSLYVASLAIPLMEQVAQITDPARRIAASKDVLQYQTDNQIKIWTALVQAIGAVVLGVGGYFTWRNLRAAQRNLDATREKLDIDREAQITNRFTQAIGQLGAELKDGQPNLEVRLGGIYALERIARDSPKDHWTIMEVLTAYVRRNAPWPPVPPATAGRAAGAGEPQPPPKPRTDIQAILTVPGAGGPRGGPPGGGVPPGGPPGAGRPRGGPPGGGGPQGSPPGGSVPLGGNRPSVVPAGCHRTAAVGALTYERANTPFGSYGGRSGGPGGRTVGLSNPSSHPRGVSASHQTAWVAG